MKVAMMICNVMCFAVAIALLGWMFISWFDVIIHNTKPNAQYLDWNFFKVLVEWAR